VLISFRANAEEPLAPLAIGDFTVHDVRWDARPPTLPADAALDLAHRLERWLG
jgi:hypothetical protein